MLSFTGLVFFAVPFLLAFIWDRKHREQGAKALWRLGAMMILFGAVLVAVLPNAGLLYYCGPLCAAG